MYTWMAVGGYVGALLTALYTFRLIFRVLPGKPCEEAQHLIDTGELYHGPAINPANEELEDADVGFPGAHHHIAEQSWPMAVAMALLGFGALFAGLIQVPGVDNVLFGFLEPAFADSPLAEIHPTVGAEWRGLAIGGAISLLGIGHRLGPLGGAARSCRRSSAQRLRPLYELAVNKWYFDEAIDLLDRAAGARDRPLRQLDLRALRRRRPGQRHQGDRRAAPAASSASCRAASCAATPCS